MSTRVPIICGVCFFLTGFVSFVFMFASLAFLGGTTNGGKVTNDAYYLNSGKGHFRKVTRSQWNASKAIESTVLYRIIPTAFVGAMGSMVWATVLQQRANKSGS